MICYNGQYFAAEQIDMIECCDSGNSDYPFSLAVVLRNGKRYSVMYSKKGDRDAAAQKTARMVEAELRGTMERVLSELRLLNLSMKTLDKRQLRIWRQLKKLLALQDEEGVEE